MQTIRDVIYAKQLEKRLGRPLTEEELSGEEVEIEFPDGHVEYHVVPQLEFPYDLLPPECFISDEALREHS